MVCMGQLPKPARKSEVLKLVATDIEQKKSEDDRETKVAMGLSLLRLIPFEIKLPGLCSSRKNTEGFSVPIPELSASYRIGFGPEARNRFRAWGPK